MIFTTKISGIPCQCEITAWSPARPMRITGTGFGDAEPPEPEQLELEIRDRKGYPAPWLANKLTQDDIERLEDEAKAALLADRYGIDF